MSPLHVLIVDDEPSICSALTRLLERSGMIARAARSSEEAYAAIRVAPIDVLVVDYRLGGQRGDELFRRLVSIDPSLAGRVIYMTGDIGEIALTMIERTGAPLLIKPFEIGTLVDLIRDVASRSEGGRGAGASEASWISLSRFRR